MGITSSNKELSAARGGSFQVRLSLTAVPNPVSDPADIILILERSSGMAGSTPANPRLGVKTFIDVISGGQAGQTDPGSRIGIVSFAGTAAADTQLITSVCDLNPDAASIRVTDRVFPCFEIADVSPPSKGAARLLDSASVRWEIDELDAVRSEGAVLEFTVRRSGPSSDAAETGGPAVRHDAGSGGDPLPCPVSDADCGAAPGPYPEPVDVDVDGCEGSVCFGAGDPRLECLGGAVRLRIRLRSVRPNRRVALAVLLSETDPEGGERRRGLKTMTIPAHAGANCRDVAVQPIQFTLPEDLDAPGPPYGVCGGRSFKARFIAHYIDI